MTDSLKQLLQQADTLPTAAPADLARRVRSRHARRCAMQSAAVALLLLSLALFPLILRRPHPVAVTGPHPSPRPVEIASTLDERIHELTAAKLLANRRPTSVRLPTDSTSDLQHQRDRAALILVYEADRCFQDNRPADAVAGYRRAIELFPQTHWANVARRRLAEMQT